MEEGKFFNQKKYKRNSKSKRHTGVAYHFQNRWLTAERHWRKMGRIQKKQYNIVRRRRANYSIEEKEFRPFNKISDKSYDSYRFLI